MAEHDVDEHRCAQRDQQVASVRYPMVVRRQHQELQVEVGHGGDREAQPLEHCDIADDEAEGLADGQVVGAGFGCRSVFPGSLTPCCKELQPTISLLA